MPFYLITVFAIILFTLTLIMSWFRIRHGQGKAEFIYGAAFLIGAFVWEDLFIFSLYGLIGSLITLYTANYYLGTLLFLVFWAVRSTGEAIYFFLEQFLEPKHYPHALENHLFVLRYLFGPISYQQCLILMQVFFQVITMISITLIILLLRIWK